MEIQYYEMWYLERWISDFVTIELMDTEQEWLMVRFSTEMTAMLDTMST